MIVAERDTSILGFGVLKLKGDLSSRLSNLYVAGANRGKRCLRDDVRKEVSQ